MQIPIYRDVAKSGFVEAAIMQIDFNKIKSMTFPGMNNGI
jgi:hypothetical protein